MWSLKRTKLEQQSFVVGVPSGSPADPDGKIIVIGAGVAGLSAARILADHGREVVVLEGRQRIGGRLHTTDVGGGRVDEGGNWIHGGRANPLHHFAVDSGFDISKDDFAHPLGFKTFDKVSGRTVNPLQVLYFLFRASRVLGRYHAEPLTEQHPEANLAERFDNEAVVVRGMANKRYFRTLLRTLVDLAAANDSEDLHPNAAAINPDYDNGADYVIAGGYSQLTERLAAGLDIHLDTIVDVVRHDDTGVEVVTNQGTHRAATVIVTVPLGVLKAGTVTFDPPMPVRKLRAIDNIGAGVVEKIVLTFKEPFWRRNPRRPQSIFYISDVPGEFPAFIDTTSSAGCPMLVAFLTGAQVRRLAAEPEAVIEHACTTLKDIFPETFQRPTATHVTTWGSDPFSMCSYSSPTIGVSPDDYDHLAEPVGGRVLFAGEATYRARAGFVEGAIGSGIREARRILGRDVDLAVQSTRP